MQHYPHLLTEEEVINLQTKYTYDMPFDSLSGCLNRCYLADNLVGNYSSDFVNFMCNKGVTIIPLSKDQSVHQKPMFSPEIYRAMAIVKHIVPDKKSLLVQQ